MKRIGIILCVALLVLQSVALASAGSVTTSFSAGGQAPFGSSGKIEGDGYDTPEGAVEAYIEAQRASDVQGMISTFAVETYVDAYDTKAGLNRILGFNIAFYMGVPVANEYTRQILISKRVAEISQGLYTQYLQYVWPYELYGSFENMVNFSKEDGTEIDAFIEGMSDPERASVLTDIELMDFIRIEELNAEAAEMYNHENTQKHLARLTTSYNCDELVERIAHVRIGGKEGYQLMQCARYGDRWYNVSANTIIATMMNMSPYANGLGRVEVQTDWMN